jgi:hypothetical protein
MAGFNHVGELRAITVFAGENIGHGLTKTNIRISLADEQVLGPLLVCPPL